MRNTQVLNCVRNVEFRLSGVLASTEPREVIAKDFINQMKVAINERDTQIDDF